MAISLYDASVACFIQTLTGVSGFLDRGLAYCTENGINPDEIVETRLHSDMFPFRFQIVSVAHHSLGAIEGVKAGVFGPPSDGRPHDYAALQGVVADSLSALKALSREEVDALEGRDVTFQFRDYRMPFVAEGFLLSFSLPNLHFHATTAYDILRMKGAPIGKRDYTGPMRLKV
ncbi:DUF1993 domain-containing protein [Phenylobacterium montanum]|uniref:DUF1993 domain-containing protein n=1 Tax=Phenylobacterium montanum TaxID=2823693 RepID=A0A975G1W0_9CAUL|nr:DUF1993 domain-containing protein [Caulobacter sp. S6]QUD89196.1 DUF1993 domain-containing protein [Caulobacter sp. S6]